jgi:hypothetical protein
MQLPVRLARCGHGYGQEQAMTKTKTKTKEQEDFESELVFHRREWRVQRVGWVFMALLPLLALAGVFGEGPLSEVRVSNDAIAMLRYERFTRKGADTVVMIEPAAGGRSAQTLQIALASDYLGAFRIEQITPEPASAQAANGRIVFAFEQAEAGAGIRFHLKPQRIGAHSTELVVDSARPVTVRQFTYP